MNLTMFSPLIMAAILTAIYKIILAGILEG
jgi:hypothetical protein